MGEDRLTGYPLTLFPLQQRRLRGLSIELQTDEGERAEQRVCAGAPDVPVRRVLEWVAYLEEVMLWLTPYIRERSDLVGVSSASVQLPRRGCLWARRIYEANATYIFCNYIICIKITYIFCNYIFCNYLSYFDSLRIKHIDI